MEENRQIESIETEFAENEIDEAALAADLVADEVLDAEECASHDLDEREEYERLIKTRFKEHYARDVQKMINRRFRKYKVMEERYKILEESLAKKEARLSETEKQIAEFEGLLSSELERTARETEERVLNQVRARQLRPVENAVSARVTSTSCDVSRLTKDERAKLAKRAANGERIKF